MSQGAEILIQPPHQHFSPFAGPGESMAMYYPSMPNSFMTTGSPPVFPAATPAKGARTRPLSNSSIQFYPQPAPPSQTSDSEYDDVIEGEIVNDDCDDEASYFSQDFAQPIAPPFQRRLSDPLSRVEEHGSGSFEAMGVMSWNGYDSVSSFNSAMEQIGSVIVYGDEPQTPVLDGEPVYDYCDVEGEEDDGDDDGDEGDDYYPRCDEYDDDDDDEDCVMLEIAASDVEVSAGNAPAQVADLYAPSLHHHQNLPSANFAANASVAANVNGAAFPGSATLPVHSVAVVPRTPRQLRGNHGRSRSVSFSDQRQQSVSYNGHQRQDSVSSQGHQQQQSVSPNGHQRQNSVGSNGHQRQLSVSSNGHQRQNSVSSNGHRRQLSGSALSTGSFTSNTTVGSNSASGRSAGSSGSATGASGRRKLRKAGTMPDQRSHGRGSLAASAAAVAATTAAGAPWGAANYGSAVGSSTSFARNTRGKRVLVKATSMPPAVESRRPSSGAGSATSGGSARTPRLPAGRPQQRQQFFPPTNAPGHAAAHPSPRARLLSAKSPRAPSAAPHGVAQVSFASPRSFRGGAGMPVPPNQQLRALAQSRSLPPQSPASAARAAAAVANVKACAFPKSPSGALSMGGRPSSGSGMAQGQARTGAGRELAPRTPRQLSASGQSNRAGPALSAALLPVSHALPIRSHSSSRSLNSQSPQQQQQQQQQQRPQLRKPKLPPLDITGIQDESQQEDLSPSVYALQSPQHSRQPSQSQDSKQPLKGILKSSKVQPEPEGGEQMDRGEQRDGVSDRKTAAALRRSGSSEAVHRVGGKEERGGLKAEGAGGAERTAGKSGEQCVQFEESTLARKGSGKGAEENRLRAAVAKGQERKLKAEKSVKGTVAKEKGSGVTRKVSREGKSKEEVVSPVMVKQCLLPWLSKKA